MAIEFKQFDTRNYKTLKVEEGYSSWSKSYDAKFDDEFDLALLNRIKSVRWSQISQTLDLACGTGRTGQWLFSKGVKTLDGVDLTEAMLEQAQKRKIYRSLTKGDIRDTGFPKGQYDLVMNSLSAEHLPDLIPFFKEAFRVANSEAHLVILGYHPHFQLRGIPTHFEDADSGESLAIQNYVHLISDFVKAGFQTGWSLTELDERVVDEAWTIKSPRMKKHLGHPISFVGVWKKQVQT